MRGGRRRANRAKGDHDRRVSGRGSGAVTTIAIATQTTAGSMQRNRSGSESGAFVGGISS